MCQKKELINIKKYQIIRKIILILFILGIGIVILDIFLARINSVDDISNLTKIKLYDDEGKLFYEVNNLHEASYVKLDNISPEAQKVFIFSEDKNFYNHSGFNIYAIIKALRYNLSHNKIIGASTITQQYVKNIYLSNEKSLRRKIRELYFAIKLERLYTKDEILEGYLNTIYFAHGLYGINDASQYYFSKEASKLSFLEAASLASIIKSPSNFEPVNNFETNNERAMLILKEMVKENAITKKQYEDAVNEKLTLKISNVNRYSDGVLFYKDYILSILKKISKGRQNIDVYTSYNSKINDAINNYLLTNLINSNVAVVILDKTGNIMSLYGGKKYDKEVINIASMGERMIGSTIKPMLYYEALKAGMSPLSMFKSEKTDFYLGKDKFNIKNYGNKYENKKITMAYALATSDNIYAVKTYLYIGPNKLINFLNKYDVKETSYYPSTSLGSTKMSLLKLTSIYNSFSQLGDYYQPKGIIKIKENGKDIYQAHTIKKNFLDKKYCFILNELMTGMFDLNLSNKINVTGSMIAKDFNFKLAGKSGLTDYDAYMIGFNPLYTVGVWSGYMKEQELTDQTSLKYPKLLFSHLFNELMLDKNKNIWYQKPNDVYVKFTDPSGLETGYQKNIYYTN